MVLLIMFSVVGNFVEELLMHTYAPAVCRRPGRELITLLVDHCL